MLALARAFVLRTPYIVDELTLGIMRRRVDAIIGARRGATSPTGRNVVLQRANQELWCRELVTKELHETWGSQLEASRY